MLLFRILANVHALSSNAEDVLWRYASSYFIRTSSFMKITGGHDNGYLPTLTALENEGVLDKVVLLTGYREIATELRGLNMSTLSLDSLFRGVKLPFSPVGRFGGPGPPSTPASAASDIAMFPPPSSRSPTAVTNTTSTSARTNDYVPRQMIDPSVVRHPYYRNTHVLTAFNYTSL